MFSALRMDPAADCVKSIAYSPEKFERISKNWKVLARRNETDISKFTIWLINDLFFFWLFLDYKLSISSSAGRRAHTKCWKYGIAPCDPYWGDWTASYVPYYIDHIIWTVRYTCSPLVIWSKFKIIKMLILQKNSTTLLVNGLNRKKMDCKRLLERTSGRMIQFGLVTGDQWQTFLFRMIIWSWN